MAGDHEPVTSRYRDANGNLVEIIHRVGLLPPPTIVMTRQSIRGHTPSGQAMISATPVEFRYEGAD